MSIDRIIPKKSSVPGKVPDPELLEVGELALNLSDQRLYSKDSNNDVFVINPILTTSNVLEVISVTSSNGILATVDLLGNVHITSQQNTAPGSNVTFGVVTANTLGVNTTTPQAVIHAKSTGELLRLETTAATGSGNAYISFYDPTGVKGFVGYTSTSSDRFLIRTNISDAVAIATAGTERMAVVANGFVGVGNTSPAARLHVEAGTSGEVARFTAVGSSRLGSVAIDTNGTWFGNGSSALSGEGIYYQRSIGALRIYSNSVEVSRVDVNGRHAIGNSSPTALPTIPVGSGSFTPRLGMVESATQAGLLAFVNDGTNNVRGGLYVDHTNAEWGLSATASSTPSNFRFAVQYAGTKHLLIDASTGNLGLGVTPDSVARFRADINNPTRGIIEVLRNSGSSSQTGAQSQYSQSGIADWAIGQPAGVSAFAFWRSRTTAGDGVEIARFDSGNSLLIGTTTHWTSHSSKTSISFTGGVTQYGITLRTADTGSSRCLNFINGGTDNGGGTPTGVGNIAANTTATSYNTTSDVRLKTNIQNANSASAIIDAIQIRSFDWLNTPGHVDYGFVAQELNEIAPFAVTPGDEVVTWSVDPSKLVPLLIKEVQELRARIAVLEQNSPPP